MSSYPTLAVTDAEGNQQDSFTVTRIICVARNFTAHAEEMGHKPSSELPFYFFKPLTALDLSNQFHIPGFSCNVQHELELVVALNSGGFELTEEQAGACVAAVGLGLDMTARDIQQHAKDLGRPWDLAKGFDGAAKCTPLVASTLSELNRFGDMRLTNNGAVRQQGNWRHMTHTIPAILAHIAASIRLVPGDLIYTGTPAGVAAVHSGDHLQATMDGFPHALNIEVHA